MTIIKTIPLQEIPEAYLSILIETCTDRDLLIHYLNEGETKYPNCSWEDQVNQRMAQLDRLEEVKKIMNHKQTHNSFSHSVARLRKRKEKGKGRFVIGSGIKDSMMGIMGMLFPFLIKAYKSDVRLAELRGDDLDFSGKQNTPIKK